MHRVKKIGIEERAWEMKTQALFISCVEVFELSKERGHRSKSIVSRERFEPPPPHIPWSFIFSSEFDVLYLRRHPAVLDGVAYEVW